LAQKASPKTGKRTENPPQSTILFDGKNKEKESGIRS